MLRWNATDDSDLEDRAVQAKSLAQRFRDSAVGSDYGPDLSGYQDSDGATSSLGALPTRNARNELAVGQEALRMTAEQVDAKQRAQMYQEATRQWESQQQSQSRKGGGFLGGILGAVGSIVGGPVGGAIGGGIGRLFG